MAATERFVWIRTDRLGETILSLPAAVSLKSAFPGSTLSFVCAPELMELIALAPEVDRVVPFAVGPRSGWFSRALRLAWRLRTGGYTAAVVSNAKKELHLAVWLAGIHQRVGYGRKWGWCLTRRIADRKALGERHEMEYNFDLVTALGRSVPILPWRFPQLTQQRRVILQRLETLGVASEQPLVAVHPWTSHPEKRWPLERFRRLVEAIVATGLGTPVIIGGSEEQGAAAQLLTPSIASAVDWVGRLSLVELAAFLQEARVLISNDSGPVHVAAAMGTTTVTLFGGEGAAIGPKRWGPWGEGHSVIHRPALSDISVEEVVTAIRQQLAKGQHA